MRVMTGSVSDLPILTLQDPADAQGALAYDCRPPLPPVSLQLSDLGAFARRRPEVSASVSVVPRDEGSSIGDVDSHLDRHMYNGMFRISKSYETSKQHHFGRVANTHILIHKVLLTPSQPSRVLHMNSPPPTTLVCSGNSPNMTCTCCMTTTVEGPVLLDCSADATSPWLPYSEPPDEHGETASHTVLPPKEMTPDQTPPA